MTDVKITKINESYLHLACEQYIHREIHDIFQMEDPNARWHPLVKRGLWDGIIRFFNNKEKILPIGFGNKLIQYLDESGYSHNQLSKHSIEVTSQELMGYIDRLKLSAHGERIEVRDYQFNAMMLALNTGKLTLESATGSGKSLILYVLIRYLMDSELTEKTLLIVPTVQLVEQMYNDFNMYGDVAGWKAETYCHTISSGKDKQSPKPIYISTWQSLQRLDKEYFGQFNALFVDEVHLAKGKSINTIVSNCVNAQYKIGVTGSLSDNKLDRMTIRGVFGENHKVSTTSELIDQGTLAKLNIINLVFEYSKETRKFLRDRLSKDDDGNVVEKDGKEVYNEEMLFLISNEARNKYIMNLALSLKGNTLILYQLVEKHGNVLDEMFKYKLESQLTEKDRKYFYINGKVDGKVRDEMRAIVETEEDAIILASYATLSTGTNIRNIHNIIFASPTKSTVRVVQSIGRGLRTSETKKVCTLYDLSDDLTYKRKQNITLKHLVERIAIYSKNEFNFKNYRIPLKNG